jgi:hypothetical protein
LEPIIIHTPKTILGIMRGVNRPEPTVKFEVNRDMDGKG